MKASLSTFVIICITFLAQNAAADNNKEISQEIWDDEEIDRIKDEVLSDFENWQEKENNGNNGQDHRRLLDPLCRRARSLVDWGESFNNRGEESFNNNPLWKEIEKRCCEPVTVRNDEHMICNTFLCIRIYIYILPLRLHINR